jgi:hypothetical protein
MHPQFLVSLTFLAVVSLSLQSTAAKADTFVFDFDDGPGPLFVTWNDGGIWTIDTDGPDLRISKPADDLSVVPEGARAGIYSTFFITGDFTITVDFQLYDFPADLSHPYTYNHIVLGLFEESAATFSGNNYLAIRFRQNSSEEIEGWHLPPGQIYGRQSVPVDLQASGRFRISRVVDVITTAYAPLGSETFTPLGSGAGSTAPFYIRLFAGQWTTCTCLQIRASNSMDIAFDNLIVEVTDLPVATANTTWGRMKNLFRP